MCQVLPTRRPAGLDERTLAYPSPSVKGELSNLVVVLPIRPGARDRARDLLRHGPPFDPDEAGLERHQAFVTDAEAVFLFEADSREAVERLADDATLWEAAEGWTELVAGPPRLAEGAYSWVRPHLPDTTSFEPTPGPGDSEGGDVYEP
jgi:hypothetical protein